MLRNAAFRRRRTSALGSNNGQRRLSKGDMKMKMNAYNDKYQVYSEMSLNDLMEMYNERTVGGIYWTALCDAIKVKQTQTTEA